jgi:hypothetical protein
MPENVNDIIAKCEHCGFHLAKPFPSFEIADDPLCPACGHDLAKIQHYYSEDISRNDFLRAGLRLEQVPRDFVCGVLEKAFAQGLESIDLRIAFTSRYDDEVKIEILSIR